MQTQSTRLKQELQAQSPQFARDVADFFAGRRAGHLSKWLYSTAQFEGDRACGADAWKHVIERAKQGSDYYVFQKERRVIQKAVPRLENIFSQKLRLIDLGPGSEDAVRDKIMPFIQSYSDTVHQYIGVDVCTKTLDMAMAVMPVESCSLEKDFIQDVFYYGEKALREMAVMFGLTLCNMAIDPRVPGLPEQLLASYFKRLHSHFNSSENWLMITQDTNQDPVSLAHAYKALSDHFIPVLYRIQRDLPVSSGFDPDAFRMQVDYFEDTQACALCFVAGKDMSFSMNGENFEIIKDQRLYFHNAFKFDEQTFLNAAGKAGFDVVESVREQDNPCILHVLKAHS